MDNVIQINRPRDNEQAFMACPCCESTEYAGFAALVISGKTPVLTGLVCLECGRKLDVVDNKIYSDMSS